MSTTPRVTEAMLSGDRDWSPDLRVFRQELLVWGAADHDKAEKTALAHPLPTEIRKWNGKVALNVKPLFFNADAPDQNLHLAARIVRKDDDEEITRRLTMTMTNVKETVAKRAVMAEGSYPLWDAAENAEGIGTPINVKRVKGELKAEGVEIGVPTFQLEVGFVCPTAKWLVLEQRLLAQSKGITNADAFQEFLPAELLLAKFTAERLDGENYRVLYTFDISRTAPYVSGRFAIEQAPGFAAKWTHFGEEEIDDPENEGAKTTRIAAVGAYASEVYERVEFADLIPSGVELPPDLEPES